MPWIQTYTPVGGSLGISALVAAIPLVVIFVSLAVLKMKAHKAGPLAVAVAVAIAILIWQMPVKLAALATFHGAAFGIFPVFYIVVTTLLLYNITVKGGQFEIIRASLAGLTGDRRLQALLIAFCFGAFIEGAAGFGTPVAIAGATLVGLGFRPFYAASVCLIANTAPVAFGAIGIPVVALAGVMGYNDAGLMKLSTMVGRQLPFVSAFIPFYVIMIMCGWKKTIEVLPAIVVCGGTFALSQWACASFLGPYLPDIVASLTTLAALVILLKVWQPKTIWTFDHEPDITEAESHAYTGAEVFRAWAPYLVLTIMVLVWGIPSLKDSLDKSKIVIPIAGLDNAIAKKVLKPEEGIKKATAVKGEIDKQLALLQNAADQAAVVPAAAENAATGGAVAHAAEPAKAPAATKDGVVVALTALKGLEDKLIAVDQALTDKAPVLTSERLAAFDAIEKKQKDVQKLAKELTSAKVLTKDQFKALDKAVSDQLPAKVAAKFTFNYLSAAGTAILIAAIISALICGVGVGEFFQVLGKTLYDMRYPAVTVASVVGLAFVMNASGMTTSLGLAFTKAGVFFPFLSPFLGMLGVFLTGSDTSSNVLFGGLQKVTAEQLGLNPLLTGAANTSGGVMGKMISPQSIAVACAATGLVGEEGNLFRFTVKHALFLTTVMGVIIALQAYVFPGIVP
ncbi:L-lactate permease [Geomesophilobacter sediminis]|uniref:L-lactate permease n=1 Tax=Geomesophilobacter sediminis TaxID=2798584 RepID=A0A8J7JJZ3_9BACT|nr:L-lactate permease [Geomesophilobacter sediminis]MBJ6723410.1 L-lactate permease [Geomesophilobacter sediminis]